MKRRVGLSIGLVFALVSAGVALGDSYIGATGGNYDVGANWSEGTVPSAVSAYIRNGATVTLDSSVPSVVELWVGDPYDPNAVDDSAIHVLDDAALTATETMRVGGSYNASAVQSGGVLTLGGLELGVGGEGATGIGTYTLTGGSLLADYRSRAAAGNTLAFGADGGTGRFIQTGGYVQIINDTYINIGNGDGALGEFTMTNGSLFIGNVQQLRVGSEGGRGTLNLAGGTVESLRKSNIGYHGEGVVNQTGGVFLHGQYEQMTIGQVGTESSGLGIYNLSDGLLQVTNKRIYLGRGYDATYGHGTGQLNVSGGSLVFVGSENMSIGYKNGHGTLSVSGDGYVTCEKIRVADSYDLYTDPLAAGWVNVSGGTLVAGQEFNVGRDGLGVLNISGGTVLSGLNASTTGMILGDQDDFVNPQGIANVSGGTLTIDKNLELGRNNATGTLNVSNTGLVQVAGKVIISSEATSADGAGGRGEINIDGGSFIVHGALPVYVGFRGSVAPGVDAELNINNGSFAAPEIRLLDGTAPGMGQATLRIGANAEVNVANQFRVYETGSAVEMEFASATQHAKIDTGLVRLGTSKASLAVNTTGYRPREGDTFTLLHAIGPMDGSFSSISSNITNGLNGALPAFAGAIVMDPNTYEYSYVVTFQGFTAGDANGSHTVDGGDLSLMGGAWMKYGQTWATCDFNGDDKVDGGDLALMGGNWMWSKPSSAPGGAALPEPATLVLLGLGGLALVRRKR